MTKTELNINSFKDDELEKRAFNVLFKKLCKFSYISLGTARQILSGIRLNGSSTTKVDKFLSKRLLSKWHQSNVLSIKKGKVRLGNFYWRMLTEEELTRLADYDARYWFSCAPHKLGEHREGD